MASPTNPLLSPEQLQLIAAMKASPTPVVSFEDATPQDIADLSQQFNTSPAAVEGALAAIAATTPSPNLGAGATTTTPAATPTTPTSAAAPTTSTASANMIRNISQTAQEREIVKTCPDIIVYLEGLPYLLNYYINDPVTNANYTIVNFNDFVAGFNVGYDIDQLVPSASITLTVPNHLKFLYQQPGGNNLIASMMQIQVYAKGYYFAAGGDTVYRRVFKGLVSHVGYVDDGKMYQISIQCYGILHMLELMFVNESPSTQTAHHNPGSEQAQGLKTIFAHHNPYQIIVDAFTKGLNTDAFQLNNIDQASVNEGVFGQAVRKGYVAKWQAILNNMRKDVHLFGLPQKDTAALIGSGPSTTKKSDVANSVNMNELPDAGVLRSTLKESDEVNNIYFGPIREFHPDMIPTGPEVFNNSIVSRLEMIRRMIQLILYEGYQDLDGKIIIKPPLYNLDVTNLGTQTKQTSTNPLGSGDRYNSLTNPLTQVYPSNNPFVVHLAEILSEQETEDQAAVRRTRMTVCGNRYNNTLQVGMDQILQYQVVEWVDVPKLAQFGLREEPVKYVPWLNNQDRIRLYAYAVSETVRANRGYRTYTVTIPLRPELKMGFPMYFPHRDMYGYIKNISINYAVGGQATMTIVLDAIRRRVLTLTEQSTGANQSTPGQTSQSYKLYTPSPNLVLKYTTAPPPSTVPAPGQNPNALSLLPGQSAALSAAASAYATTFGGDDSDNTKAVGSPHMLTDTGSTPPTQQQCLVRAVSKNLEADGRSPSADAYSGYNVQNDGVGAGNFEAAITTPGGGVFTYKRSVDESYLQDLMKGTLPYTDDKGYELLSPFPWGRWQDLNTCVKQFTEMGYIVAPTDVAGNATQNPQDIVIEQNTDAFLFAGLGTPTASGSEPSGQLLTALTKIQSTVGGTTPNPAAGQTGSGAQPDATIIVLDYSTSTASAGDSALLNAAQPEDKIAQQQLQAIQGSAAQQQLVSVLVSGKVAPSKAVQEQLIAAQTQAQTATPRALLAAITPQTGNSG